MRAPAHRYEDPLDRIWVTCAARIGLRIGRAADVYAATDGKGALSISTDDGFDADDSLAQMIFHELCHSLVEGATSFDVPDWGLDNSVFGAPDPEPPTPGALLLRVSMSTPFRVTDVDSEREHACIRVQATLARVHGLHAFFAPTTGYRAYYDALPEDALLGDSIEVLRARRGAARASQAPWAPHLEEALAATATVLAATRAYGDGPPVPDARALLVGASLSGAALPSLHATVEPPPPHHPRTRIPLAVGARAQETCGSCAWLAVNGVCRQSATRRKTRPAEPACERWETQLDCQRCGACCREAFGAVTVRADEPVVAKHPALVRLETDGFRTMRRVRELSVISGPDDTRCVALEGDGTAESLYTCSVYADRPRTCHEFTLGSAHCLTARRRVGLSR